MIPVGYMAKISCKKPDFLQAESIVDVYSVSSCVNEEFADYIGLWRHNGYWLFDSPRIIREIAEEKSIDVKDSLLFYYEAYEKEFTGEAWRQFAPEAGMATKIEKPAEKRLEGFDVVTFFAGNSPECSPLSCNSLADTLSSNKHCLFDSFEMAKSHLDAGDFIGCEHGPYRIFAVYSVPWP